MAGPSAFFKRVYAAQATPSVATPTGTSLRTVVDTASVTLPQLAGIVKALVEDLKTKGTIK